jgi:hypothetical protein
MQQKKRFQPASYKSAEGKPDGIVTKLILISKFTRVQIKTLEFESEQMERIAKAYRNIQKWIESQPDGTREKFKSTVNRVRFQAEAQMIKEGAVYPSHLDLFRFDRKTLMRKIALRRKLIDYLLKALSEPFFIEYIRAESLQGYHVNYDKVTALKNEFEELLYRNLIAESEPSQEQIEEMLNQEHTIEEPPDEPLTDQERHRKLLELSGQIGDELNLRNKEKRKPENLCLFLLYNVESILSPRHKVKIISSGNWSEPITDDYDLTFTESIEGMKERISTLSRSNLIQLIRIFCEAHNDFYKDDISDERQINKMETNNKRPKKKTFTAEEKQGFVALYKDDKITQKELAKQLGCSDRWVRKLING